MANLSIRNMYNNRDSDYITRFQLITESWRRKVVNVKRRQVDRFVTILKMIICRFQLMLYWDRCTVGQRWRPQVILNRRSVEEKVQVMLALIAIYTETIIPNILIVMDVLDCRRGTAENLRITVRRIKEGVDEAIVHVNTLGGITGIQDIYGNCGLVTPGHKMRNTEWKHPLVSSAWDEDWYPNIDGVDQLL
jgi:hypothetical protein